MSSLCAQVLGINLNIIAQVVGFFGMAMNFLSFVQKSKVRLILCQLVGTFFWTVHFLLLGINAGSLSIGFLINLINIVRNVVFAFGNKFRADNIAWTVGLIVAYAALYPLTFTVFGKEPTPINLIVELLPVIGVSVSTVSFRMLTAKGVRRLGLIASPMWLVYDAFSGSIGGVVSEVLNLTSIILGTLRYDIKRKPAQQAPTAEEREG